MTDEKFNKLLEFIYLGEGKYGAFDDNANQMSQDLAEGESVYFEKHNPRDLKLHRAYMAFISYLWNYLPEKFQLVVPEKHFYHWLKRWNGDFEFVYKFKNPMKAKEIFDHLKIRKKAEKWKITYKQLQKICDEFSKDELIEYTSISFARMDESKFRDYVKGQLPKIYDIFRVLYEDDIYQDIIETIEKDWEKFFNKLFKSPEL